MRRVYPRISVTALVILIWTTWLPSAAIASPAGVIPYACIDDEAYVLLAFDPAPGRVGYGAFGGRANAGESLAETAAREMREETRCAFEGPSAAELAGLAPSISDGYASFVAEVRWIPPAEIPASPCEVAIERADWLWVKLPDLVAALDTGDARPRALAALEFRYINLWEGAAESLRAARRDGLLGDALCR